MNRSALPDEYIEIAAGAAFTIDWFAPPIDTLTKLFIERTYSILQQLILEFLLRIYQSIREIEKNSYSKIWNLLRTIANRALNYAASIGDPSIEKHVLSNILIKLDPPIRNLLQTRSDYSRISVEQLSVESVYNPDMDNLQLIYTADSQSEQIELQQYNQRIANLSKFITPDKNTSVSQYLIQSLESIRFLQSIRLDQLRSVASSPIPEFEFIKIPKLFLVYSRDLISQRKEPKPGEYLKCVTLLPQQSITYKIEKIVRSEKTRESSSCVVDSNSAESQQSLSNELQKSNKNQIATSQEQSDYFREQNHLDTALKLHVNFGDKLISNVGANFDSSINWSNDRERSTEFISSVNTEAATEQISKAISSQASKANTARQITLNEKTSETLSSEERNLTEITMQNVSKIHPIQIQTYQAVITWESYIALSAISLFASNGLSKFSTPVNNIAHWKNIIAPIYTSIENELKKLKIRAYNGEEVSIESGFTQFESEIGYGIPVRKFVIDLNSNGLIEIVKLLDVQVLDQPSVENLIINNDKIRSEIEINKATAAVIYKISDGELEITELGKILFAVRGKDPIGSAQYLRLDNDSNTKFIS